MPLNNKGFSAKLYPGVLPLLSEHISNGSIGNFKFIAFQRRGKKIPKSLSIYSFFPVDFFFFFGDSAKGLDKNKTALCWVLCEYGVEGKSCGQEGVKQKKKRA